MREQPPARTFSTLPPSMLGLTDSPSQLANLGLAARRDRDNKPSPSPLKPVPEAEALPPQLRPRIRQLVATNAAHGPMPPPASPRAKPRPSVAAVAQRSQVTNMISAWSAKTPAGASPTPTVPPIPSSLSSSRLASWREDQEAASPFPTSPVSATPVRKAVPVPRTEVVRTAQPEAVVARAALKRVVATQVESARPSRTFNPLEEPANTITQLQARVPVVNKQTELPGKPVPLTTTPTKPEQVRPRPTSLAMPSSATKAFPSQTSPIRPGHTTARPLTPVDSRPESRASSRGTVAAAKAMFEAPSLPPSPAPPATPRSRVAERVAALSQSHSRPVSPSPMPTKQRTTATPTRQRPKSMFETKTPENAPPTAASQRGPPQLAENRRVVNTSKPSDSRPVVKPVAETKLANPSEEQKTKAGWIEWKPSATYDANAHGERLTLDNEDREIAMPPTTPTSRARADSRGITTVHVGVRPRLHPSRKDQVLANNLPDPSIQLASPRSPLAKTETAGDQENTPGVVFDPRIEASKGNYANWVSARPEREEGMGPSRMWAPQSRVIARATEGMSEAAKEELRMTQSDADRAVRALTEVSAASEYHTAHGTPHDHRYAPNPWYYNQGYYYDPAAYQEQYGEYDEYYSGARGYYYDPYWGYQHYPAPGQDARDYATNRAGAWAQDQMTQQQPLHDPNAAGAQEGGGGGGQYPMPQFVQHYQPPHRQPAAKLDRPHTRR